MGHLRLAEVQSHHHLCACMLGALHTPFSRLISKTHLVFTRLCRRLDCHPQEDAGDPVAVDHPCVPSVIHPLSKPQHLFLYAFISALGWRQISQVFFFSFPLTFKTETIPDAPSPPSRSHPQVFLCRVGKLSPAASLDAAEHPSPFSFN